MNRARYPLPAGVLVALLLVAGCGKPAPATNADAAAAATDTTPDEAPPVVGTVVPTTEVTPVDATTSPASDSIPRRAEQRAAQAPAKPAVPKPAAGPAYAQVVSVKPVLGAAPTRNECRDVEVTEQAPVKDEHRVAGTAIGAVVGGAIGNQVGGGRGRDLATIAGAIGGGVAGREIQERQQQKRTISRIEQRCETVRDGSAEAPVIAYDIVYSYAGETHKARIDHDPGDRIALPVRSID